MDGIILINKDKGITSRDVVNIICKKYNTRRVGHTGTLDPLATGLMVICLNSGCKLVELLSNHDKEYIAKVKLGIRTDTYDITGKVLEQNDNYIIEQQKLEEVLNSFIGTYLQEVPIYSSIKVHGKKLYEYARSGEEVSLPKREVTINEIQLIKLEHDSFTFKVNVSKGTYIRSLINDISKKMNILMTMEELKRTKVGKFDLVNSQKTTEDLKIISLIDAIDIPKVEIDDEMLKKVENGVKLINYDNYDEIAFIYKNNLIAIYKKDHEYLKAYRVFKLEQN